jgi:hypothetical protein
MLFRDLKAYQHALRVAALSRPLINRLPASERDLADQWRRACNSVVSGSFPLPLPFLLHSAVISAVYS